MDICSYETLSTYQGNLPKNCLRFHPLLIRPLGILIQAFKHEILITFVIKILL